jgi:phosphoglycolate phosphatase
VRPRILLLDLDGPILDVRRRYYAAHRRAAEGLPEVRMLDAQAYWAAKRRRAPLAEVLGVPADDPAVARYRVCWLEVIEADDLLALDGVQPRAVEALERLRVFPERVVVTLRTSEGGVRATLERLDLLPLVTAVEVVSHAAGSKRSAFARRGAGAVAATVAIGDTEVDIEAAQHAGFPVIAVSCGIRSGAVLSTLGATAVVPDLMDAAGLLLDDARCHQLMEGTDEKHSSG